MSQYARQRLLLALSLAGSMAIAVGSCSTEKTKNDTERVSSHGSYTGYSDAIYAENYHTSSQYIEMRDGTKIAIDIYRPIDKATGKVVETPLPVVWMHTPYNRRYNNAEQTKLTVDHYAGTASRLIKYGYVVATADFRGLYASYGHNEGFNRGEWMSSAENDAYDITEWLAKQPWSTGRIGMWGCSATGGTQMQALTKASPHLKAIFPMSFEFDVYDFRVSGGITGVRGGVFPRKPGDPTPQEARDAHAAPVDGDSDRSQLDAAIAEHAGTVENEGVLLFKDSRSSLLTDPASQQWWIRSSPTSYLDEINQSGVAVYMAANWDEGYTKPGPFFAFNNFKTKNKLVLGPGVHCDWNTAYELTGFDIVVEELRFFDYWLKGVENGVMEEDPVYYYTYHAPAGKEWKSAKSWPLPEEKRVDYYLTEKSLDTKQASSGGKDQVSVDFERKPESDQGVLRYETTPLAKDLQVTGHPQIKLWVSSTASDGDFVATIREIAPDGTASSYNVQGQLRASMRKPATPPYNYLGLPWHSYLEADALPLVPGEPAELDFALLPISMIFREGHRIQLEISFVGRGTPKQSPAPEVTIYRDADHQSVLTLPVIAE